MKAPKCKICGKEHWGSVCFVRPEEVKTKIAKVAPRPAAKRKPKKAAKGKS